MVYILFKKVSVQSKHIFLVILRNRYFAMFSMTALSFSLLVNPNDYVILREAKNGEAMYEVNLRA